MYKERLCHLADIAMDERTEDKDVIVTFIKISGLLVGCKGDLHWPAMHRLAMQTDLGQLRRNQAVETNQEPPRCRTGCIH